MMVIRPVERGDLAGLMQLAGKTGGGLTSLPADEKNAVVSYRPRPANLARDAA